MATPETHRPDSGADVMLARIVVLLESINSKMGEGTAAAPDKKPPIDSQLSMLERMIALLGKLGQHGQETQAKPRVLPDAPKTLPKHEQDIPEVLPGDPEVLPANNSLADTLLKLFAGIGRQTGSETKARVPDKVVQASTEPAPPHTLPVEPRGPETTDRPRPPNRHAEEIGKVTVPQTDTSIKNPLEVLRTAGGFAKEIGKILHSIGFAHGGGVGAGPPGPPGPTDTVPAMLSPGEYVLSREMVKKLGLPHLERMRAGGNVLGFAKGGHVPDEGYSAGEAIEKGGRIAEALPSAMADDPKAILTVVKESVQLFVDNVKSFGRHIKEMGRAVDKAMMSDRLEDQAMAGLENAEAGGKLAARVGATVVAGPIGGAILGPIMEKMIEMNPMMQFSKAVVESVAALRRWNDALHNANMQFAEFSGQMAAVQARQEYRDVRLSQTRGGRRAASAEYLAQGKHGLNERFAVFEDFTAIIKNRVVGTLDRMLSLSLDWAPVIGPLLSFLPKIMGGNDAGPFEERLKERADRDFEDWSRNLARRPRHL